MYSDLERKIFRIYFNTSIHGKSPTLKELMRWTGKTEAEVRSVVILLIKKNLILRDKENNLIANRIKVK
ncbi:hypothetical protein [Bacillus sp. J37]|uniref:hypothetical protein n=1 Tax=Bacillus sp. J37 TaxID=935837 RepID=UPI0004B0413B|nr:hypothetical protein [Bacillus sp. J37]